VNKTAAGKLFGQVTGLAINLRGNLVLFHRGDHVWDADTFDSSEIYLLTRDGPIREDTIIELQADTLNQVSSWGSNLFFLPHGLTIDSEDNVWLTDVALHQVLKFDRGEWKKPSMTLGKRFEPGSDNEHFCKPTSVAVDSKTNHFFVSDGYCNSRVIMFNEKGIYIKEWGERPDFGRQMFRRSGLPWTPHPFEWNVPHKVVMKQDSPPEFCIADRENGRVQCVDVTSGDVVQSISKQSFNGKVYSISMSPSCGLLFVVAGPSDINNQPVMAFAFGKDSDVISASFAPPDTRQDRPPNSKISVSLSSLKFDLLVSELSLHFPLRLHQVVI
jgi:peptidylamidoglycolate lyase